MEKFRHGLERPLGLTRVTDGGKPRYALVIGVTRPDVVDQSLRRPRMFDHDIALGVPNENSRIKILTVLTRNLKLEGAFNLVKITRPTPGFVRTDLKALVKKAGNLAMNKIIGGRKVGVSIEIADTKENEDWWKKLTWSPEDMEKRYNWFILCKNDPDPTLASSLSHVGTIEKAISQLIRDLWIKEAVIDEEMSEIQANCILNHPFALA
nr:cell division control protein 48 homolog C-like [Tanacetum cinerariifolium]